MAITTKVTFTLDDLALNRLQDASDRLQLPKSEVIREAIAEFYERIGRLSERERARMLQVIDEMLPNVPVRPAAEVDGEIADIREARRSGGRRTRLKEKS